MNNFYTFNLLKLTGVSLLFRGNTPPWFLRSIYLWRRRGRPVNEDKIYDTTHPRQINATSVCHSRVVRLTSVTQQNRRSAFLRFQDYASHASLTD